MFESRADVRLFLSLVARAVRRGTIEVHAYCVMTTHFHMLVRSPVGRISDAMQWIEDLFARRFNRSRRRDGSLFRGRFRSIAVRSNAHWSAVLAYIDRNPLEAHIVPTPSAYPWGSAYHYARASGPLWLTRARVEAVVQDRGCLDDYLPDRYDAIVDAGGAETVAAWVELSIRGKIRVADELDELVGAAPDRVRDWMQRKARLADGSARRTVIMGAASVRAAIEREAAQRPGWTVRVGVHHRCAWAAMRAGLLRTLAAARLADVARWEGVAVSSIARRERWHRVAIMNDAEYADVASRVAAEAMRKR
jgi:REP element-mobilizing transposase RayT